MNFLTYLYYKYYRFQVRVGNGDIALFSSIMFMMCIVLVYYWGILFLTSVVFPIGKLKNDFNVIAGAIILSCSLLAWCWLRVWREKRYKKIIEYYEKISPKSSWGAVLVPIFGFLLFNLGWILKMLQNEGKI